VARLRSCGELLYSRHNFSSDQNFGWVSLLWREDV